MVQDSGGGTVMEVVAGTLGMLAGFQAGTQPRGPIPEKPIWVELLEWPGGYKLVRELPLDPRQRHPLQEPMEVRNDTPPSVALYLAPSRTRSHNYPVKLTLVKTTDCTSYVSWEALATILLDIEWDATSMDQVEGCHWYIYLSEQVTRSRDFAAINAIRGMLLWVLVELLNVWDWAMSENLIRLHVPQDVNDRALERFQESSARQYEEIQRAADRWEAFARSAAENWFNEVQHQKMIAADNALRRTLRKYLKSFNEQVLHYTEKNEAKEHNLNLYDNWAYVHVATSISRHLAYLAWFEVAPPVPKGYAIRSPLVTGVREKDKGLNPDFRGPDLIGLLIENDLMIPASQFEHWLTSHCTEPSASHLENIDAYDLLDSLPPFLWDEDRWIEYLGWARPGP